MWISIITSECKEFHRTYINHTWTFKEFSFLVFPHLKNKCSFFILSLHFGPVTILHISGYIECLGFFTQKTWIFHDLIIRMMHELIIWFVLCNWQTKLFWCLYFEPFACFWTWSLYILLRPRQWEWWGVRGRWRQGQTIHAFWRARRRWDVRAVHPGCPHRSLLLYPIKSYFKQYWYLWIHKFSISDI